MRPACLSHRLHLTHFHFTPALWTKNQLIQCVQVKNIHDSKKVCIPRVTKHLNTPPMKHGNKFTLCNCLTEPRVGCLAADRSSHCKYQVIVRVQAFCNACLILRSLSASMNVKTQYHLNNHCKHNQITVEVFLVLHRDWVQHLLCGAEDDC